MISRSPLSVIFKGILIASFIWGCAGTQVFQTEEEFGVGPLAGGIPFASEEVLRLHEANLTKKYLIGSGDRIRVEVWNRDKLTGEHIVGPYGLITLPMLGDLTVAGMTREEAAGSIAEKYAHYYDDPIVTVKILQFLNNKAYVLGRVSHPGVIHFNGQGTLLEALSLAGGLPTRDKMIFLSKCYIVRGREQIIWVDLVQLLQKANTRLNVPLANNDIIYIPESMDEAVFVMGEVKQPGTYPIQTQSLSVLDAINMAGSNTEDANLNEIRLIRNEKGKQGVKIIDLEKILAHGNFSQNFALKDNDIIYIPRKGVATFNYYLRQIDPFLRTFISATIIDQALE